MSDERKNKMDALLGRALRDRAFRQLLVDHPAEAAKEVGLTPQEVELVAGGLAIGTSLIRAGAVMYCTEKTCNEKGGARAPIELPATDPIRRGGGG